MKKYLKSLYRLLKSIITTKPHVFAKIVNTIPSVCDAYRFSSVYNDTTEVTDTPILSSINPLWEYFQSYKEGQGIDKWEHYFDIYHRHFAKFVDQKVNVLEIGIHSGGSLEMWRSYFGEKSHIYGVDIEEACKAYENDHVSIFIGDQSDRSFWSNFRERVEGIDILIDDGGHTPEQQQITLEEMLQHLRPGGVYVCEDIHGDFNRFSAFATSLVNELNIWNCTMASPVSGFQAWIHSIHFYPYMVVIEKHHASPTKLLASRHGTKWNPW